jgi:hypothetical protein
MHSHFQEWQIFNSEGCVPQDVPQRNSLPGKHQQDHEGRHFKFVIRQILNLGFSWTGAKQN